MNENEDEKILPKNEIYTYQSFSKNNSSFTTNENKSTLRTKNKEELIDFSFKKKDENNDLTSTIRDSKGNLLNIYSKDDKNIIKSGHFAKIRQTKNKKKIKEFIKPETNYLIKTLFLEESNSKKNSEKKVYNTDLNENYNKENLNIMNNLENELYKTVETEEENFFEKIKTKTKIIIPNRKKKKSITNKILFNRKLLTENNNGKNKLVNRIIKNNNKNSSINQDNIKIKKNINNNETNNKNLLKKKVIKIDNNKLFKTFNTNSILKTKNIKLSYKYNFNYLDNYKIINSSENNITNKNITNINDFNNSSNSYLNKTLDINQNKNIDPLFNKFNNISKRLILFSEFNRKLKKQIKNLNEELSSFENSKSKKLIKSDKRIKNNGFLTTSPNKNNSSFFNSEIKNILFRRKIINSNYIKYNTYLNKSKKENQTNSNSFSIISEFSIKSNKKSNSKNKNISRNQYNKKNNTTNKDLDKSKNKIKIKDYKKRRIKSNNIFDFISFAI